MADLDLKALDAVSRRRLQNRLNQQASRKRRALQKQSKEQTRKWVVYTDEAHSPTHNTYENTAVANRPLLRLDSTGTATVQDETLKVERNNNYLCASNRLLRENHLKQLQLKVLNGAMHNLQAPSLLIPVTQFNIMQAMISNAATMGLSIEVLCEDIASEFNISAPYQVTLKKLPPSLQPSSTQKEVIHHPWIDLIPIKSLRNSLLSNIDVYDEDEICTDFCGLCGSQPEVGLLVWGEAWDPAAYEVTVGFFRKWSWLLRDCPDLIISSNKWRKKRGEPPLVFEGGHPRIEETDE